MIVSGRDPLEYQNFEVSTATRDQSVQSSCLQSPFQIAHEGQNLLYLLV